MVKSKGKTAKHTGCRSHGPSKSKKFKSIRAYMDTWLPKHKESKLDEAKKALKKEFPLSNLNVGQFGWYRFHILTKGERAKRK